MTDPHIVYHQLNGFNETRAIPLPLITMVIETKESLTANYTQPRTEAILRCVLQTITKTVRNAIKRHQQGEFPDHYKTEFDQWIGNKQVERTKPSSSIVDNIPTSPTRLAPTASHR
jgi:GTPase SAR1 family protein